MPFDPKGLMFPQVPVVGEFNKLSGYERVFSNMGGEGTIYYRLPSLGGYDAVYIKRYGEFIASLSHGSLIEAGRSVVSFPRNGSYAKQAVDLLGVKYIVHKVSDGHAPWAFPFWTSKEGIFPTIYNDGVYQVFENRNAFPRVFLVSDYTVESNPQKILDTMFGSNFNLRKEIVLEQDPKLKLSGQGEVNIANYSSEKISITTNSNGNNLLFLSDTYYPGWQAYVDGHRTQIYRADFAFRAIYIPKGEHQIEFIYNSLSFNLGVLAAALGALTIFAFLVIWKRGNTLKSKI
jgi:hypothetical protein